MRIVLFVEKMDACRKCLPDSALPAQKREGRGVYLFENHAHQLHLVEIGEQKKVEISYRSGSLVLKTPPFTGFRISIGHSPCLVIVQHWDRGVIFQFNNRRPEARALQTGLKGNWESISRNRCVAAASGGSDPIFELLECFFEHGGRSNRALEEIEKRIRARV